MSEGLSTKTGEKVLFRANRALSVQDESLVGLNSHVTIFYRPVSDKFCRKITLSISTEAELTVIFKERVRRGTVREEVGHSAVLQTQVLRQFLLHHLGGSSLVQLELVLQHWYSLGEKERSGFSTVLNAS